MAAWKVLAVMGFGGTCLALALSAIVVPLALEDTGQRWAWCGGLLAATAVMGTLFTLFLRHEDARPRGLRR